MSSGVMASKQADGFGEEGRAARARCEIELERRGRELEWQWAGFLMHTAKAKV